MGRQCPTDPAHGSTPQREDPGLHRSDHRARWRRRPSCHTDSTDSGTDLHPAGRSPANGSPRHSALQRPAREPCRCTRARAAEILRRRARSRRPSRSASRCRSTSGWPAGSRRSLARRDCRTRPRRRSAVWRRFRSPSSFPHRRSAFRRSGGGSRTRDLRPLPGLRARLPRSSQARTARRIRRDRNRRPLAPVCAPVRSSGSAENHPAGRTRR